MGLSAEEQRTYQVPWDQAFDKVTHALGTVPKMVVKNADRSTGRIQVSKKMSLKSWGENVLVDVFEAGPGQTTVKARSQLKAQLVDWGANKQNLRSVFEAVERALGAPSVAQ